VREVERVPQLAAGWQEKASELTPEQGFLLSRIDGQTDWAALRSIAGVPAEHVDRCIEEWLRDGLVELVAAGAQPGAAPAGGLEVDATLAVPVAVQRQALELESALGGSYHALLGVSRDADAREIKRSYFKLAREFHPDRYFGKDVGAFGDLLDRIFKQIALAYELLMDPTTRAELERSMSSAPEPSSEPAANGQPQKFSKREWLARMRKQFRLPEEVLAERRHGAKQLAESARVAEHQCNWKEAASCIRLAIAFDPWDDAYKERFAAIHVEVNRIRAEELLRDASGAWDSRSLSEALKLYEEVLHYRPADAEATDKAAQLCYELEEFDRALEFAELACELRPEVADYQLTRGRILRRTGRRERAQEAIAAAQKLDPQDTRIADEIRKLRKKPKSSRGGKQ
jgi:curved DNA-binding protein CbpA